MSGWSDQIMCPNCGKDADLYGDYKPFDFTSIFCDSCGLVINPKVEYMALEELNAERGERNLPPLKKLPKQTFEW